MWCYMQGKREFSRKKEDYETEGDEKIYGENIISLHIQSVVIR